MEMYENVIFGDFIGVFLGYIKTHSDVINSKS